jgi:hypothetical protein
VEYNLNGSKAYGPVDYLLSSETQQFGSAD